MSHLLSKGTFGCVYRPKINCNGQFSNSKVKVTKVQNYDETAEIEINISNIVKTIENYEYFFSPIQSTCPISYKKINKNIIKDCNILQKHNKKIILMELDFVDGKNFIETLQDVNPKSGVKILLDSYSHILQAISLLLEKNIVHYDLNSSNIVYNKKRNIPILVDFGLSININTLNQNNYFKSFYGYFPDYYLWSPEIHFLCYLINREYAPTKETIDDLARVYVKKCSALTILSDSFKKMYESSIVTYLQQFLTMTKEESIQTILKYYKTWDNFSLSILYLNIIKTIFFKEKKENVFLLNFTGLLIRNINANPEKRLSIKKTKEIYKTLFLKLNLKNKDFGDFLNKFEKNKIDIIKESKQQDNTLQKLQSSFARL